MRYNTKKQPSKQCRACGTINISKNVNNWKFFFFLFSAEQGEGGGGGVEKDASRVDK